MGDAGDGIARDAAGAPVFLRGGLPGERVRARPLPRRGPARAAIDDWLSESAERQQPPCPLFGPCGGCAVQHWADGAVADWKRERLRAALVAAGFADPPVGPTRTTPPGSRRRADLGIRRGPGGIAIGLHAADDPRAVVDMRTCRVLEPRLLALLPALRTLLRGLPALRREGSAVLALLESGPDLLLRTDAALDAAGRARLAAFAAAEGLCRVAWARGADTPEIAAQTGPVALRLGPATVAPPPGAFLQPTAFGEAAIRDAVLAGLPPPRPGRARIVELYAGLGTLSLALAGRAPVHALEGDAAAVAALTAAAGRAGLPVRAERRDMVRQPPLPAELRGAAAIVLDPPFAGAAACMPAIAAARAPRVLYVSCNPAALARDAAALHAAGYAVAQATPIDQFRWSAHLEAVIAFSLG